MRDHNVGGDAKRLAPSKDTLRELYLRSGNLCAFPGCTERILDVDGDAVGEICHIAAAALGGERFDPKMKNEERRSSRNLLLLCRKHHKKTNDVNRYPAEELRRMKAVHEAKFSGAADKLAASFRDQTLDVQGSAAESLARMNEVLEWQYSEEQLEQARAELDELVSALADVPLASRELLEVIVTRGEHCSSGFVQTDYEDLIAAVAGDRQQVVKHVRILERHGIVYEDIEEEYAWVMVRPPRSGWRLWQDLIAFAEKTDTPLRAFTYELRFDLLD